MVRKDNPEKIVPPGNAQRFCGMHWLRELTIGSGDGYGNYIALQWNPGSKTWTHSDNHDVHGAQIFEVNENSYEYVEPIAFPQIKV